MSNGYTPSEIATIVQGQCLGLGTGRVEDFEIDSRRIFWGARTLFVAVVTERNDGHHFVVDAQKRGVQCAIVQRQLPIPDLTQIVVKDSVEAIQKLAEHHRKQFDIPVLAITGSNGKTIVKEWLNQLCAGQFRICRSPRSFNSQLGVPLSILQINESHTLAIIEAGISEPGEMNRLEKIIAPTCGIFTHLGETHLHHFTSQDQLFQEKEKLFGQSQWVIAQDRICKKSNAKNYHSWGHTPENDWQIEVVNGPSGTATLLVNAMSFVLPFDIPFLIDNACNAICAALKLGVAYADIQHRVQKWSTLEMRMEQLEGVQHTTLYNDAYSFDIPSLRLSIDEIQRKAGEKAQVLILSELPEGSDTTLDYDRVIAILNQGQWEMIFLVGHAWESHQEKLRFDFKIYSSTIALLQELQQYAWHNQAILVKGARSFGFEQVIQKLQARNHITCLEVGLNAIQNNLNYFRQKLNPGVKTMVMVKAFGYGSGSVEVAEWLAINKVDYLGVAYVDEGIALREGGISLPIMVMNPEEFSVGALCQFNLEPEIYSLHVLEHLLHQKDLWEITSTMRIHLKVDTGMRRLGFDEPSLLKALAMLQIRKDIEVVSVMSHLASAENHAWDGYTQKQLEAFEQMVHWVKAKYPRAIAHMSNTSGIVRWPQAQHDMVRLGIGLYGYSPVPEEQVYLQNVHVWKTHISQIREIEAKEYVGYGCSFEAKRKTRVATIPVGYADGLKRALSNGIGSVEISGSLAPIIGRVCMDMTMVDVTDIHCKEGDEVILLGGKITLKEMAEQCSTIPYEILTSISNRVKRKYIKE